jgi:site-specific DNA-methyltransferase (adenine-specific)
MGPLWEQLLRVGRPDCVFVFTAIQPFMSLVTCSNLSMFRFDMVWRKNKAAGHLNAKKRPMRAHEDLLLFWAKTPVYRPQMTEGHAPMHHAVRRRASTNYGSQRGAQPNKGATTRYPTTVLDIPVLNNDDPERCNATQKPMALPAWFIKTYTKPGDLVLDPTAGSGTTLRAAQELGRCFAGFDMDVELVRQVNERWLFPGKERAA